jgi:hypothetical protein
LECSSSSAEGDDGNPRDTVDREAFADYLTGCPDPLYFVSRCRHQPTDLLFIYAALSNVNDFASVSVGNLKALFHSLIMTKSDPDTASPIFGQFTTVGVEYLWLLSRTKFFLPYPKILLASIKAMLGASPKYSVQCAWRRAFLYGAIGHFEQPKVPVFAGELLRDNVLLFKVFPCVFSDKVFDELSRSAGGDEEMQLLLTCVRLLRYHDPTCFRPAFNKRGPARILPNCANISEILAAVANIKSAAIKLSLLRSLVRSNPLVYHQLDDQTMGKLGLPLTESLKLTLAEDFLLGASQAPEITPFDPSFVALAVNAIKEHALFDLAKAQTAQDRAVLGRFNRSFEVEVVWLFKKCSVEEREDIIGTLIRCAKDPDQLRARISNLV